MSGLERSAEALVFEEVERSFGGGQRVLAGLSAEIPLSGLTFVVGKSGSGKSVLCRMAVGLLRPDRGGVYLLGRKVHDAPERELIELRRRVPYLVQGPALLDWLTLEENVALTGREPKTNNQQPTTDPLSALERVGLGALAGRYPPEVGPGVRKRAAIARALLLGPRYLLLDEPTTGLDRDAARQVNEVIGSLRREGLGALVISHDYRALEAMADRVLLVSGGRAAFFGDRQAFLSSGLGPTGQRSGAESSRP